SGSSPQLTTSSGDNNNGHGNDAEGVDTSNPAQNAGPQNAVSSPQGIVSSGDNNNGHGNDAEGVDSSNPGGGKSAVNQDAQTQTQTNEISTNNHGSEDRHNRGHGNDRDGIDQNNPSQGIGGPNSVVSSRVDDGDTPGFNPVDDDMGAMFDSSEGNGWHDIVVNDDNGPEITMDASESSNGWVDAVENHGNGNNVKQQGGGKDKRSQNDEDNPAGAVDDIGTVDVNANNGDNFDVAVGGL
ncbi:MAG: hypothetical protein OEZ33_02345, partial [Gammaproteobacteria bacterium]|nr:hypothetical protein [Gammaproteobacteria bacterium]